MKLLLRVVGFVFISLIFAGLGVRVLMASHAGQAFYGQNYYGQPLGVYSTLAVFAVAAVALLIAGVRWIARVIKRFAGNG